jgi:hypothetical protein
VHQQAVQWTVPLRSVSDPIQQRSRLFLTQSMACLQAQSLATGLGVDGKQFIDANKLYACTSTESWSMTSRPFASRLTFRRPSSMTLITSTRLRKARYRSGLDIVAEVSLDIKLLRYWDTMGQDTWSIFPRDTNYHKIPTTKPLSLGRRCHHARYRRI